jgi:uncharacterized membrane protein YraQ (UPF0718 family)
MNSLGQFLKTQKLPIKGKKMILPAAVFAFICISSVEVQWYEYDLDVIRNILTVFTGIIMQSFPFLMAGALLSSAVHEFVPDRLVAKFLAAEGKRTTVAALFAAFLFPVCDCAAVPAAAGFCRKKFPLSATVVFMLSSPMINPVVIASTWYAFGDFRILLARIGLGILIPVVIGLAAGRIFRNSGVLKEHHAEEFSGDSHDHCGHAGCGCGHEHHHEHGARESRLFRLFAHAGTDFVSVLPFVIAGAAVSSILQIFVPKNALLGGISGITLQTAVMIGFAFVLSICSTSDAFFARSFMSHVSTGPALAFMTAGPMIDFKNTLMMSEYFRKRFILFIAAAVALSVFLTTIAIQFIFFRGL